MPPSDLPLLVFSDLDGTLLDHETYSWDPARDAIAHLHAIGAGLVLASSKTAAELAVLRDEMGLKDWPAIVENGAGILWPEALATHGAETYADIRALLAGLPAGFRGFGDMTAREVADLTGLAPEAAQRAKTRAYSEPGLWQGTSEGRAAFLDAARAVGLEARQGGRFLTLSRGRTKADAMAEITARLRPARTLALGDAPNDAEMLAAADHPVLVANPAAPPMPPFAPEVEARLIRTAAHGPTGWALAVEALTNRVTSRE